MSSRFLLKQYFRVYRFDRWIRQSFTTTGHLFIILLIVSGVYGVDTKSTTTYQLFVFLLITFICSWGLKLFNRCQFSAIRQLPKYATASESVTYTVKLSIHSKHKQADNLAFIEQLSEPLPVYSALKDYYRCNHKPWYRRLISFRLWRHYLVYQRGGYINEKQLPPVSRQGVKLKISFMPLRRGKLIFSGCYLAKPDLLGLWRKLFFVAEKQTLLVLPKRYEIKPILLPGKRKYQAGGVTLANSVGDSSEFMSLRDYRQGDALNTVHWKSYARHGKLIVKEYQDEYFVRRGLLLDTFIGQLDNEQFEAAVTVAASVAMNERQNDALLDLMFVDQKAYCFTAGRGVDHMPHLQEILASVQARHQDEFVHLQNAVMHHAEQCSSLICVFLHWNEARQNLIKQLILWDIPVAVFLIHGGTLNLEKLPYKPEYFYPLNYHHLAEELIKI